VPSDAQRARLERADRLMKMATRFDLPLIILAALMMAVARYL
jgi:acetyl-CoA carboxylase alpha subunit